MLQKMNLTAVTDVNKVMGRHNEDSLAILPPLHDSYISHYNALSNLFMLGPRAGLPGLVLAITCPVWKVTLFGVDEHALHYVGTCSLC